MNTSWSCKSASRGFAALAIVALLFASTTAFSTADQKEKKKDSSAAKPAPVQKTPAAAEHPKSSGAGKNERANTHTRTGGESNTTVRSGGSSTRTATGGGGTSSTNKSADTSAADKAERRRNRSEGASSTGKTGDTGTATKSVETSTTDKAARRSAKSGGTNPTGKSGDTSTANKTGDTSTTNKTVETSTTDKAARRKAKSEGVDTAGKTGETNTSNKTGATTSTDKAERKSAKSDATNSTGKNTSTRLGVTRTADGKPESFRGHDGSEARFRRDGTVREVHARGMTIVHSPSGSRRVVVERVDHTRIVAYRGGYGYVQRPFQYRNHEFASRTYFYHGRPYARYYQRYPYRGLFLEGYRPYRYYRPAFYGWAYNPWRAPVRYSWGWVGNPWYGYYGGYFTPYQSYPSAAFWLTDYLIASSLQQAYQQRSQASYVYANAGGEVVLTPEVKRAIADEVQGQLALENAESRTVAGGGDVDINSSGLPRILAEVSPSHPHVFVVAGPLEVTDAAGLECALTEGDVLRLSNPPRSDDDYANLEVYASKNQSCRRGSLVSVGLADLQEMQNHMRASIDQGLQELEAHPNGLPAPPAGSIAASVQAPFAQIAPPADANVSNELQEQVREANAAERGVLDQVRQEDSSADVRDPNTSDTPVQISLGQTIKEVVAAMGNPKQVVNLGSKKIYVYADLKVTFVDGRVTDVQ